MDIHKNLYSDLFFFMIITILITGCGINTPKASSNKSIVPKSNPSATKILPTKLITTVTPYPENSSTTMPTRFFTPVASITPTPTPLPSLTPRPTLSELEAKTRVVDLLTTNGNCLFPCFWGITPGKTSWAETKNLLLSISNDINSFGIPRDPNIEAVEWAYQLPNGKKYENEIRQRYFIKDDDILIISPSQPRGELAFPEAVNRFSLSNMLKVYGKPDEIYIQTYAETSNGSHPFSLLIVYSRLGIMANYRHEEGQRSGNMIYTCVIGTPSGIIFWNPDAIKTMDQLVAITSFPLYDAPAYQPLDKTTDLTIDKFYDTMMRSGTMPCIKTPAENW